MKSSILAKPLHALAGILIEYLAKITRTGRADRWTKLVDDAYVRVYLLAERLEPRLGR